MNNNHQNIRNRHSISSPFPNTESIYAKTVPKYFIIIIKRITTSSTSPRSNIKHFMVSASSPFIMNKINIRYGRNAATLRTTCTNSCQLQVLVCHLLSSMIMTYINISFCHSKFWIIKSKP